MATKNEFHQVMDDKLQNPLVLDFQLLNNLIYLLWYWSSLSWSSGVKVAGFLYIRNWYQKSGRRVKLANIGSIQL